MVRINDEFKYKEETEDRSTEKVNTTIEDQRFKGKHIGDILIEVNVKNNYKSKSRVCNAIKIASNVHRAGVKAEKIKNIGFNKAEIKCRNINEPNKLLDLGKKEEIQINCTISRRVSRRKGVIMDWDLELSLMELIEAIPHKDNILSLERMKKDI